MTEVSELKLDSDASLNGSSSHLVKGCLFIIDTHWRSSQRWSHMDLQILKTKILSILIHLRPQQPWLQSPSNDSNPMVLVFAPLEDMSHPSSQILLHSLRLHSSLSSPPWPLHAKQEAQYLLLLVCVVKSCPRCPQSCSPERPEQVGLLGELGGPATGWLPFRAVGSLCHAATWVPTAMVTRYS